MPRSRATIACARGGPGEGAHQLRPRRGAGDAPAEAEARLLAVIGPIEEARWHHLPAPDVWSIGKDVEHVIGATIYHQWIVRTTIGQKVGSRRPPIERKQMKSTMTPAEAVEQIRLRTNDGVRLIDDLTDEQLDLVTRPPRAQNQRLAETIEHVLIGHYDGHRGEIKAKLE